MNNRKTLISIIIPVYNVEKYIEKCLNSVINQTYKYIEIILVDDGSTDNSGNICEEYAKKDKRIKVYHKKNGGLSSARNYGLNKSKGEYLTFIDSDDTIEINYVEELFNLIKIHGVKCSIGAYSIVSSRKTINIGEKFSSNVMDTKECLANMFQENGFTVSACAKMYHKSLFDDIRYPEGKLYEDNGTTYKLVMLCDKIAYSNKSIYKYYIRKSSITNKEFSLKKMDYISLTDDACEKILKKYPDLLLECNYRKAVSRLSILRQMLISKLTSKEKQEQNKIINYFRMNYKEIINNRCTSRRMKLSLRLLKINKNLLKLASLLYEKIK